VVEPPVVEPPVVELVETRGWCGRHHRRRSRLAHPAVAAAASYRL